VPSLLAPTTASAGSRGWCPSVSRASSSRSVAASRSHRCPSRARDQRRGASRRTRKPRLHPVGPDLQRKDGGERIGFVGERPAEVPIGGLEPIDERCACERLEVGVELGLLVGRRWVDNPRRRPAAAIRRARRMRRAASAAASTRCRGRPARARRVPRVRQAIRCARGSGRRAKRRRGHRCVRCALGAGARGARHRGPTGAGEPAGLARARRSGGGGRGGRSVVGQGQAPTGEDQGRVGEAPPSSISGQIQAASSCQSAPSP